MNPRSSGPRPATRALRVFAEFFRLEAASGLLLIVAAVLALVVANSPWASGYLALREWTPDLPGRGFDKTLLHWVNDGLMAVFFLLVSLEIKREATGGALAGRDQRVLPLACAVGGVVVPALIFFAFNPDDADALRGWAVPTATDIAFAMGVLALLGSRVPMGMKLLLSTIAVVDDLIAIVVIALFYSHGLSWPALALAALVLACMGGLRLRRVRVLWPYLLLGALLWICVLKSGVHATLAGVATGLMIPHVDRRNDIDDEVEHSPLETLEHVLHPGVAYVILPLFAFLNAGLPLGGLGLSQLTGALPLGIALALVAGKPVGIVGTALALRGSGLARFPVGMALREMLGLGLLCGIGFTMSLFVASLAYGTGARYEQAVLGVLAGSLVSALLGLAWLRAVLPRRA